MTDRNRPAPSAGAEVTEAREDSSELISTLLGFKGTWWTIALFAMVLLGGTGPFQPGMRLAAQLIAAVMTGFLVALHGKALLRPGAPMYLLIAVVILALIQSISLPAGWTTSLPGRDLYARDDLRIFGREMARSISLDPGATVRSLPFLLPAMAVYLAVFFGGADRRAAILRGVVLAMAVNVALQFLQVLSPDGAFVLEGSNRETAPGLFSNRNHLATFMLATALLVIAAAFMGGKQPGDLRTPRHDGISGSMSGGIAIAVAVTSAAVLGTMLTGSRAALVLVFAMAAILAAGWAVHTYARRAMPWAFAILALGAVAIGGLLVSMMGSDGTAGFGPLGAVFDRSSLSEDARYEIWPLSWALFTDHWVAGSGFGTFRYLYEMHEPLEVAGPLYSNHAHSDLLEWALEGGVAMISLMAGFAFWLGRAILRVSRMRGRAIGIVALTIAPLPMILHSAVDYPLRTIAGSVTFAICIALLAVLAGSARLQTEISHRKAGAQN